MSSSGGAEAVREPAHAGEASVVSDGEIVILSIKPHPLYILLGASWHIGILLALALPVWLVARSGVAPVATQTVLTVTVAIVSLRIVWQALDWMMRSYILTDRRVIRLAGVLRRYKFEASLRSIQHLTMSKSIPERLFALGSVGFATAGTAGVEAYWLTIADPEKVMQTVREAMERYGRKGDGGVGG